MEDKDRLKPIADVMYEICEALTAIVDLECCTYGFDDAVSMAMAYMKGYEEDHPDET